MRSIVYAGNDFSEICSAEVIERAANPIIAEAMAVPGRAGALLVSGYIPPVDVRVRLFMGMGYNPGFSGMAQMRGKVRRWLSWPGAVAWFCPTTPRSSTATRCSWEHPTGRTSSRPASAR